MTSHSKTVTLLVTGLMVSSVLTGCQSSDEPLRVPSAAPATSAPVATQSEPSTPVSETPTEAVAQETPPPGSSTSSIDPAGFEGYPPPVVFEPFFARTGTNDIPYPESYGSFHVVEGAVFKNPDRSLGRKGNVQATYSDGQGRSFLLHVNPNFGSYAGTMRAITGHHEVGISICGTSDMSVTHCAAASDDADLTISGLMEAEELDAILQEVVACYQERA